MTDARSGGGDAGDGARDPRQGFGSPATDDTVLAGDFGGATVQASTPRRFNPSESDAAFLRTEASNATPSPFSPPIQLPPRFELKRRLGAGGMGEVALAHDNVLGRDVAIKVLRPGAFGDRAARDRLLHEAQAAAQIRHPHIVSIHDVDLDAGLIVMEYLSGGSGRTLLEARGPLSLRALVPLARALCSALEAAHAAGLVHRDIKPDNVLFDADGVVKVADFGVASSRRKTTTGGSEIVGTPAYMAPEQLRGADPDPRADIYALGLTLYELATGRRFHNPEGPSDHSVTGLRRAVGSRSLARILARCLAEDPAQRYPSAKDLGLALASLEKRRQRLRVGLLVAIVAAITAVPLALFIPRGGETSVALLKIGALPFDNRTADASLEWLRQGFANLISSSLRRRGIPAVRHSQIRDIAGNASDPTAWAEAARAAGASEILTGQFERQGQELLVTASLRGNTYRVRGRASRADAVADEIAGGIARDLVGEEATPQRRGRSPEAMRLYEMGYAALQQHEFQKAVETLREAIRLDPDFVDARYALITARSSVTTSSADLVADVDDALSRALSPRERALFEALRLRVLQRYEEAAARYDRLVSEAPTEKEAHYGLADSLFHLGRYEQAMAAFKRLVKLAPSFHLAYHHPAEYLGTRGRARELNAHLYHLRRASPPPTFLALMEARLDIARRNYPRALDRLKAVSAQHPDVLATMADLHAVLGAIETARELYAQASALAPDNWSLRIERAALDLTQGHLADFHGDIAWESGDAAKVSEKATRLATRGLLYAVLGRSEEAKRDLMLVRSLVGPKLQRQITVLRFLEGMVSWTDRDLGHLRELLNDLRPRATGDQSGRPAETLPFLEGSAQAAAGKLDAAVRKFRDGYRAREDPKYAPVYLVSVARASLEAGDRAAAASACEEVLKPPAFSLFRSAAVPPCLGILALVRDAQGRREEARRHARTLLGYWRYSAVEIPELAHARRVAGDRPGF